jgi:hypothetical protein
MDQDSVLFTVNIFTPTGFNAIVFAVAKARMYNGSGFAVPVFGGNPCTVAPPYVLDQNARSFFLIACPNDNKLTLKAMVNSSQPTGLPNERTRFFTVGTVAVAAYSVPPLAPQAGVNYPLETGDNRIENRTLQVGNRLIAVHTIRVGTATPKWYMVNTASAPPSVLSTGIWFATLTSSDWRPHLTAAPTATGVRCFGTWMSNDASRAIQLQVRFIGDDGGSSCGSGAGTPLFTSSLPLTSQTFPDDRHRTGDYGAAALDPNRNCAWVLGEVTNTITTWGSRYGKIGFTGC